MANHFFCLDRLIEQLAREVGRLGVDILRARARGQVVLAADLAALQRRLGETLEAAREYQARPWHPRPDATTGVSSDAHAG